MSIKLDRTTMKLGKQIKHRFCNLRQEIVFIGKKYIVTEDKYGMPLTILDNKYDLWEIKPRLYEQLSADVLERAYSESSNLEEFFERIKQGVQNFKESSLP